MAESGAALVKAGIFVRRRLKGISVAIRLHEKISLVQPGPVAAAPWNTVLSAFNGPRSMVYLPISFRHTYAGCKIVTGRQALRLEKERLERERDKKIDTAIRRIQRERLEFEENSKAEAEEEARRLDEVCSEGSYVRELRSCEGIRISIDRLFFFATTKRITAQTMWMFPHGHQRHCFNARHI